MASSMKGNVIVGQSVARPQLSIPALQEFTRLQLTEEQGKFMECFTEFRGFWKNGW